MGQVPHIEVGDTPTDIAAGLEPGCYVAQVGGDGGGGQSVLGSPVRNRRTTTRVERRLLPGRYSVSSSRSLLGAGQPPTWVKTSLPDVPLSGRVGCSMSTERLAPVEVPTRRPHPPRRRVALRGTSTGPAGTVP